MESRLRAAVRDGELDLHYQPVVDLSNGATTGVEALARWSDRELGDVPPDVFIPLAETTDLIVELGRWVLMHACSQAVAWSQRAGSHLVMSVNVSPVQLRESSFVDDVRQALEASGLAPERLVLEVTETAIVTDVPDAAATLHKVRDLGVHFALDDFGTGHSSLTLLRNLPLQSVKIDRSLISKVATGAQDAVLVQLVVDAAHTLGLRVCAEGVEQVDQAQQLVSLGCDTGQGWLFGRPVPATTSGVPRAQGDGRTWLGSTGTPPVALSGSEDLIVVTDRHRFVTYVSASCRRILGRMPSEVVGRPLGELLGFGHDEGAVTLRVPDRDGEDRWLRGVVQPLYDGSGDVREILSVLTDVTLTVLGDQALADSEELFRSAFSGAPIGIALSDFDGRLLRVNPALALLLGRSVPDLLEMSVADITHPEDLPGDAANLAEVRAGAVLKHRVVKRYLHADGHPVPVEVYAASVRTAAGEPSCVVAHVLPAGTAATC